MTTIDPDRPDSSTSTATGHRTVLSLLTSTGGGRYAGAVLVSAVGGGLMRPFLLLYAVLISHLSVGVAGLSLSAGFLTGLAFVPLVGRWLDHGARLAPMQLSLLARAGGLLVLLVVPGQDTFVLACLILGTSDQVSPIAGAAMVSRTVRGRDRDATLAAMRSLANAGLGIGALLATVAVAGGDAALRWLAVIAAGCYLAAAGAVATMPRVRSAGDHELPRPARTRRPAPADRPAMRRLTVLNLANLPYAFCFDVLEVALPAVLVTQLHVSPGWSSAIFVVNTSLVIAVQLPVVRWLARLPRRTAFAAAGVVLTGSYLGFWGAQLLGGNYAAGAIAVLSILYTFGEITYTAVNTALVIDAAPAPLLGRALARWQLSAGIGRALAPLTLTFLLTINPGLLWVTLAATTCAGAWTVRSRAPLDTDHELHAVPN